MSVLAVFAFAFAGAILLYVLLLPFWAGAVLFGIGIAIGSLTFFCPKLQKRYVRLTSFAVAFGLLWVFCYELWQIRPLGKLDGQLQELALVAIEDGEETDGSI